MKVKKYLLALPLILAAPSLYAVEIGNNVFLNGKGELDLVGKTNQTTSNDGTGIMPGVEYDLTLNLEGKHPVDGDNYVIWRAAQKLATDTRYDSTGFREAWAGLQTMLGTLTAGNQFSNIYLTRDGYASYGQDHLYSDYGANEAQYSRSVSYLSPSAGGFRVALQYDLGGAGAARPGSKNAGEIQKSYAYEAMLKFANADIGLTADAGYYHGKNNGSLNMVTGSFNGTRDDQTAYISGLTNDVDVILVGATYVLPGGVDLTASWTRNNWKGESIWGNVDTGTIIDSDGNVTNDQILGRVGVAIGEKNYVSLGYQWFSRLSDDSYTYSDAIQSVSLQYNRGISGNATAFVQARHTMYDGNGAAIPVDTISPNKDNVTKLTLGVIVTF